MPASIGMNVGRVERLRLGTAVSSRHADGGRTRTAQSVDELAQSWHRPDDVSQYAGMVYGLVYDMNCADGAAPSSACRMEG
jgi:hypothetical protein